MTSTQETVTTFLKEKGVPLSLRSIASSIFLKKRAVLSVCHQEPGITKVHPSHCGSGKDDISLFMWSTDEKWASSKTI